MNFSKRNVNKEIDSLWPKGRWVSNKVKAIILMFVLVIAVLSVYYAGRWAYDYLMDTLAETPEFTVVDATPTGYISAIYDADGNQTTELVASGANRIYVTLEDIPLNLQHAFVAIEDERFYEHHGIDMKGIVRALFIGLSSGSFSEGASTITQQLLKNNVFDNWTTETGEARVRRKLQEQYLALELEQQVSKDWIMENYLNTINLGQNTLGVQSASQRYFGKDVSELTLSECATLAAITQNPTGYNPISHPEENNERRLKVLENMLDQGYITNAEYEEAVADDVYSRIIETNYAYQNVEASISSYFDDALTKQVIKDLQDILGYTESQAYNTLYGGGIEIYSTQDPAIQEICDNAVNNDDLYDVDKTISFSYALTIQEDDDTVKNYSEQTMFTWLRDHKDRTTLNYSSQDAAEADIYEYREWLLSEYGGTVLGENIVFTPQPQASMSVVEQSTGQVKALVGGRGEKTASKTLNRASDTTMQPGSTFKIITTYAPALDDGIISLASSFVDEEITYADGKVVKNADGVYRGTTTIREAITNSINVIAILTSRELTLEKCYESALNFGITTLTDTDIVEALPLGGITNGVTNLELTAAYAAIANEGIYNEPILYTRIVDHDGNVLLDRTPESHRVVRDTTAWLLTSAMEDVVTQGTGTAAAFDGMTVAGKTGTTSQSRASWFVGYTPYYTCAVWGGYDDNTELASTNFTKLIWRQAMMEIHEGLEDIGFPMPAGIETCTVCTESGLLVGNSCTSIRTEYFANNDVPTEVCNNHTYVLICNESGMLANEYCPSTSYRSFVSGGAPTEYCTIHTTWVASEYTPNTVTVEEAAPANTETFNESNEESSAPVEETPAYTEPEYTEPTENSGTDDGSSSGVTGGGGDNYDDNSGGGGETDDGSSEGGSEGDGGEGG